MAPNSMVSRRMIRWTLIAAFTSPIIMSGAGWWYTSHAIANNNHKLCDVLAISDRPVSSDIKDPIVRQRQQTGVALIHKLRIDYGCVKK